MELILALIVVITVIIFGALISIGNHRQQEAIDGLREQVVLWATQDLRIKREKLAFEVKVDEPLSWFNNTVSKIFGCDLKLQLLESFDEPQSVICMSGEGAMKIVFSPLSPADIRNLKRSKHSRLAQFTNHNPLLSLPRDVKIYELSALNGGILFDMEISLAWKGLTGRRLKSTNRLWVYEYL